MTELLIGQPVLISIDHQRAGYNENYAVPQMGGYAGRVERAVELVEAARSAGIPVIFIQERHARTLADFGRELDGSEESIASRTIPIPSSSNPCDRSRTSISSPSGVTRPSLGPTSRSC